MGQWLVVEQRAEPLEPDVALTDAHVTIGLSAEGDGGVIAMTGPDPLGRDDRGQLIERLAHPLGTGVVVAGRVCMGRVEADAESLPMLRESRQDLGQVLEARP